LSEAVGLRLLAELPGEVVVHPRLQRGGVGYLRSRLKSLRQISRRQGVLLLTDMDRAECPVHVLEEWLEGDAPVQNLFLRVAVHTVESWALADHQALRGLLGQCGSLPPRPDELPNPKQHLLKLAQRAPRKVRVELVKEAGAIASQGIGYNALLSRWIMSTWSPQRAAQLSPSLRRTRERLRKAVVR
jgi:hypothetical protein